MTTLNATYLLKGHSRIWPPCSESFWTTLFSQFLLHLATGSGSKSSLTIWHCRSAKGPPWYEPRAGRSQLDLDNLTFESITVEPPAGLHPRPWPDIGLAIPAKVGGFSPDVVIRFSPKPGGRARFAVVEHKIEGSLQKNQVENYPALLEWLRKAGVDCQFLLLQSVGAGDQLYRQARKLQDLLKGAFGIVLWEEVIRCMLASGFKVAGVDLADWQRFTVALDTDAAV